MATSMEAATAGAIALNPGAGPRQFQELFEVIPFTFTFDEDSIAASAVSNKDITVTGAALGDFVLVAGRIDLVSVTVGAFVQSANTVTVWAQNQEVSDPNTTLAGNTTFNGLVLKVRGTWARL